ncbi:uncharacterized protein LOC132947372 isoform X1 [Metopolophium dirhodum]|uniref:uncharacterized protein LOC132947372 isoform X1 n=2 Tax=Metopolophium dirhodum TaxID=44670 RepID=UPI0029901522|nr:uncharacterized protein LOC132947372 isoform X1 [Metopolophium dirhodum]
MAHATAVISGLTAALLISFTVVRPTLSCRISEFMCKSTGGCVQLDEYCDGKYDCPDRSDEPPSCTACNRTYYGEVGKSYRLTVKKLQKERPFLCHLSFTASGQEHGDFVELIFEEFRLGTLYLGECISGEMQILELGRPYVGGSWCGYGPTDGTAPAVYYSEAGTVTLTLRIPVSGLYTTLPFAFGLRFKFLDNRQASVRLGTAAEPKERGELVPGTHCSRNFYECYRKRCSLQSPNYPGMYPRNVTCRYTVRQKVVPKCKHAMVSVTQGRGSAVQQSHRSGGGNRGQQGAAMGTGNGTAIIRVNDMCSENEDRLVFHDGPSEDDPVLLRYCGGPALPRVVASGPAMLVVFKSWVHNSPATFSWPPPVSRLRSFELDVRIAFVDSDSLDYVKGPACEFTVNASATPKSRRGVLVSPRHAVPPNSTCTYRFQGLPDDRVWMYFESYGHRSTGHFLTFKPCPTRLRIWDGAGTLLGDHCDTPRLCEHIATTDASSSAPLNVTRPKRPCTLDESYLSKSPSVILQVHSVLGTVLEPFGFRLHYEFVDSGAYDRETDGDACVMDYRVRESMDLAEPRNVFLYGRGGAKSLDCVYRLQAEPGYRLQIVVRNASFGSREHAPQPIARTVTGKYACPPDDGGPRLAVREVFWRTVRVERGCFCQNFTEAALGTSQVTFDTSSDRVEIHFHVPGLGVTDDFVNTYFSAHVRVLRWPACPRKQWVRGSGGEIELAYPPEAREDLHCRDVPWLLEARPGHSMFVQTWGRFLPVNASAAAPCRTRNRILLYAVRPDVRLVGNVCPAEARDGRRDTLYMFSDEWTVFVPDDQQNPSFMVEFVAQDAGSMAFKWLEVSKPSKRVQTTSPSMRNQSGGGLHRGSGCAYGCPELEACISPTLWCDGHRNCPSGVDEADLECQTKWPSFKVLKSYGLPVVGLGLAGVVFAVLACVYCRREPEYKHYDEPEPATENTTRSCSTIAS